MNFSRSKLLLVTLALVLALLGSGLYVYPQASSAASILPNMSVTLASGGSTYASTVYAGKPLIFRATVKNIGNVPLQVVANLTTPTGWEMDQDKYSDCPDSLAVRGSCTISWYFTPQVEGQVYLRVYARGYFTNSEGVTDRITRSPAFIFNVKPPKGTASSGSATAVPSSVPTSNLPNMSVALYSGSSYYASTVYAGKPIIFRATVKNIGSIPLKVTANLTYPTGWEVDQDKYSDCPDSLAVRASCTISWYFTPQVEGQVYLRVYVRGAYTDSTGVENRITRSPAFIFNVKPPKTSD